MLSVGYDDDVGWLVGRLDDAVVVGSEHLLHVALPASLGEFAGEREGLVSRLAQRGVEVVDFYLLLLATVSVGDVEYGEDV